MLDEVKKDLRITHSVLDEEISADISAALAFIETAGVLPDENDPLIRRCVKNYCRWHYDYNKQGELYRAAFDELLKTLTLSQKRRI